MKKVYKIQARFIAKDNINKASIKKLNRKKRNILKRK